MLRSLFTAFTAFAALAAAQTHTDCDPTKKSCPANPALGTTFSTTFNKSMTEMNPLFWNVTAGSKLISFGDDGAALALQKKGDSIAIQSQFYIMWGQLEIIFKAAPGVGLISTAILISSDLDEVDWEVWGFNKTAVSANWYGQGDPEQNNAEHPALSNAQTEFHNYTIDWTKDRLQYILDGQVVREVPAAAPKAYPQTPSMISFGLWSAGDSSQPGTVEWAGGKTDWSQAPFVMTVRSIRMTDYTTNVTDYTYGDNSGSWQSIKAASGQSQAAKNINKLSTTQQVVQNWQGLSQTAKIAIAASVLGSFAILMIVWCWCCCIARKKGREEKRIADKEWDDHQNELLQYKRMQQKGQFAVSHMSYGNSNRF